MSKTIDKAALDYRQFLQDEEKSAATTKKYLYDVKIFAQWCKERPMTKSLVLLYKNELIEKYSPASVNSILSSLNSFFEFQGWHKFKIKMLKIQKQIFPQKENHFVLVVKRDTKACDRRKLSAMYLYGLI